MVLCLFHQREFVRLQQLYIEEQFAYYVLMLGEWDVKKQLKNCLQGYIKLIPSD